MLNHRTVFAVLVCTVLLWASMSSASQANEASTPASQVVFEEDFENDLSRWRLYESKAFSLVDTDDEERGKALELTPSGIAYALIEGSDEWGAVRIEGEFLFPVDHSAYLGLVYNFGQTRERTDFGSVYLKGDRSYLRVNPWRDGNASRLLYEEYRTNIRGADAVETGQWHKFRAEIVGSVVHFYVGDFTTPKLIFPHYERDAGLVGFKPRVAGEPVWLDNVRVEKIEDFSYRGPEIPALPSYRDEMLTDWEAIGPLAGASPAIERSSSPEKSVRDEKYGKLKWQPFETDGRGAVITGRLTHYVGEKSVGYFRTIIKADEDKDATLHFKTVDELSLWVNGQFTEFVYRQGYVSGPGYPWNAWYDFAVNPDHAGRRVRVSLKKGENQILIRVRNGQFASGGFFAALEEE